MKGGSALYGNPTHRKQVKAFARLTRMLPDEGRQWAHYLRGKGQKLKEPGAVVL